MPADRPFTPAELAAIDQRAAEARDGVRAAERARYVRSRLVDEWTDELVEKLDAARLRRLADDTELWGELRDAYLSDALEHGVGAALRAGIERARRRIPGAD